MPVIDCIANNGHSCVLVILFSVSYQPIKVALIQLILNDAVLLKLTFRKGFCNSSGNFPLVMQNFCIVELQKSVQLGGPICHGHGDTPTGLPGGVVQLHRYDFVQLLHLIKG